MKVPFLDLHASYLELKDELDEALLSFLQYGQYIGGSKLTSFESSYANFVGAKSCVGIANGLEAIELSLKALGVGHGDEVIIHDLTGNAHYPGEYYSETIGQSDGVSGAYYDRPWYYQSAAEINFFMRIDFN